ncbi:MAG: nucleotidyl transferase AbiEii/AbiGii toxin family protein [Coleofasciculaceae cyanobacterium]
MSTLVIPDQLPFLQAVCWQIKDIYKLTPQEMLQCYERGWHYRGVLGNLDESELNFVNALVQEYGSWLGSMVHLAQHQTILDILSQLNAIFLNQCKTYFGGGTLLALTYDEYRLSQDIDFLCSDSIGYRQLRQAVYESQYQALFQTTEGLIFPREIQANQYGIRFPIVVGDLSIRLEIVSEGRIELGSPERLSWCPVACLNAVDQVAEKLLANSDRWPDTSVLSRDLIDLAIIRLQGKLPAQAFAKAEAAYPVIAPLQKAIAAFQQQPDYRSRCYEALQIKNPGLIIDGLDQVAVDFGLAQTERMWLEQD